MSENFILRPIPPKPKLCPKAPPGRWRDLILLWQEIQVRRGNWPSAIFDEGEEGV